MSNCIVNIDILQQTADAIRKKAGTSALLTPSSFPAAISAIVPQDDTATRLIEDMVVDYSDNNATSIKQYAFYGSTTLKSVACQNVASVGTYAFNSCTALETVDLSNCATVGAYAFASSSVVSLTINANSNYMCSRCSSLQRLDLLNVSSIATGMLQYCTGLNTLIMRYNGVVRIGTSALSNSSIAAGTCNIYVPDALVDTYKTGTWKNYAAQVLPLSELGV